MGHGRARSEEHTSELQSLRHLVCRLLLEKKKMTGNGVMAAPGFVAVMPGTGVIRMPPVSVCHLARSTGVLLVTGFSCFHILFFFNNRAPPEIYPLPLHGAFSF